MKMVNPLGLKGWLRPRKSLLWFSAGDAISPEEDAFLMQQASQPVDPAAGSHSPRSEAGTVSGKWPN